MADSKRKSSVPLSYDPPVAGGRKLTMPGTFVSSVRSEQPTGASSTETGGVDANIPVVYQMIKAEVQNLLDKMTNAQIQDVVESATKIRDKAMLLTPSKPGDGVAEAAAAAAATASVGQPSAIVAGDEKQPPPPSYSATDAEATRLVNELTVRRKEELNLLRTLSGGGAGAGASGVYSPTAVASMPVILEDSAAETGRKYDETAIKFSFQEAEKPSDGKNTMSKVHNVIRKLTGGEPDKEQLLSIAAEATRADHLMPIEDLEQKLFTKISAGLTTRQMMIHRNRDGLNVLLPQKTTPVWIQFLRTLISGFGLILWVSVILAILAYWPLGDPPDPSNLVLGFVILVVIFVQGIFSFIQQRKASNLIASFLKLMPTSCQVLRDGSWTVVPAQDLVVGDVIRIKEGDKLPADLRIFEAREAKIEKSSLTGESDPVPLTDSPTDRNIYETQNMALFGTSLVEGAASGLVVNTGDRTVMGKIAQMTSHTKSGKTSLEVEINHFMLIIVTMAVCTIVVMLLGFFLGIRSIRPHFLSVSIMVTNCIAVTVALLPDGLPISVITILTLVGRRLYREKILVKKLTVTETLGSATLIASDKTGTITMNQMTLHHLWTGVVSPLLLDGNARLGSTVVGLSSPQLKRLSQQPQRSHLTATRKKSLVYDESCVDRLERAVPGCVNFNGMGKSVTDPTLAFLIQAMCLCNKSNFERVVNSRGRAPNGDSANRKVVGTPTEGALLAAAEFFFDVENFRSRVPIVDEIPFSSRRKFHLTVHQIAEKAQFANTIGMIRPPPDASAPASPVRKPSADDNADDNADNKADDNADDRNNNDQEISESEESSDESIDKEHPPDVSFHYLVLAKGAPEYILSMCGSAVFDGYEVSLGCPELVAHIMKANERMAMEGERVLAFAFKRLRPDQYPLGHQFDMRNNNENETKNLCLLGLVGILDPPRPGVADAIRECHDAGVRVMMVTGDHPTTAVAISRMVNIITRPKVKTINDMFLAMQNGLNPSLAKTIDSANIAHEIPISDNGMASKIRRTAKQFFNVFVPYKKRRFLNEAIVVTGKDLSTLTKPQWDYVLAHNEVVFARTTPQQKLQIVKESQHRGDIIAVTGDGVNDAPALKAANLGVAMGLCGSDVSKEAANMVLLDDNFVTIVKGIKQGRLLFDNLKKVICYLLPAGSYSEILPVFAWVFLGMPQPLSAILMIVICVGTDMCGSMGLVHEQAESDIMRRPPRNAKSDRLVNLNIMLFTYLFIGTMESIIAFFMYFLTMYLGHVPPSRLVFAFEDWGRDFNITVRDSQGQSSLKLMTAAEQNALNSEAQTAFFVSLVVTQLWNLLSVRTRFQSNFRQKFDKRLLWFMLGEVIIMLFTCYLPVFNELFSTAPMKWYHFVIPACLGSLIFFADELRKWACRRWPDGIIRKLAW